MGINNKGHKQGSIGQKQTGKNHLFFCVAKISLLQWTYEASFWINSPRRTPFHSILLRNDQYVLSTMDYNCIIQVDQTQFQPYSPAGAHLQLFHQAGAMPFNRFLTDKASQQFCCWYVLRQSAEISFHAVSIAGSLPPAPGERG
jgi:hypothetical protein